MCEVICSDDPRFSPLSNRYRLSARLTFPLADVAARLACNNQDEWKVAHDASYALAPSENVSLTGLWSLYSKPLSTFVVVAVTLSDTMNPSMVTV